MVTPEDKQSKLKQLAEKRKRARIADYSCLHEFHDGFYECDYVSPWSISAHNEEASVVIVGQDWSSTNYLEKGQIPDMQKRGYDPQLATNKNLQCLLRKHFRMKFADVYATNLFPFIKKGGLSSPIRPEDLVQAAREFLLPQIKIIEPKIAICLGKETFNAIRKACGHRPCRAMEMIVRSDFDFCNSRIFGVAHTGSRGTHNRGRELVDEDWSRIGKYLAKPPLQGPEPASIPSH